MGSKMTSRLVPIVTVALCAFVYGLAVATYKVFPFEHIQYIKNLVVEAPDVVENAEKEREVERFNVYYFDKKSFFENLATRADIVMIGDSMVDGAEWKELLPNASVVNRGIAGDSIEGVLNRMDSIYSVGAKKAFIMAGYNDLRKSQPANQVFENYKMILGGLLAHGTRPYILSTIFVGQELVKWNENIMQLNALLENYAKERRLVYIDLNAVLAVNDELNPAFTRDGIHLNGEGYARWARALEPHMNE